MNISNTENRGRLEQPTASHKESNAMNTQERGSLMTTKTLRWALASLLTLVLGAPVALANTVDLRADLDEDGVAIEADTSYRAITVRITGEGQVVERSFPSGESAYLAHGDFNLPDGQYRFEAVLTPDIDNLVRRSHRGEVPEGADAANRVSGSFRIANGSIILDRGDFEAPSSAAAAAPTNRTSHPDGLVSANFADQVIVDDLIVQGSGCIGQDCANGEAFGFDTLRLKENNLRIRFEDTSNSASFPSTDWQLTANDSSNGGANKFSIEDLTVGRVPFTIEGGAANNSVYVDDAGNLGLNTNAPVVEIHLRDGDSPTLRLEQDGSSGFGSQTWDVAGNETNFFVRDATNGSRLPFKIFPNAPTNSLTVEGTTGDIGVGIASPTAPIHVRRTNGTASLLVEEASGTTLARGLLTMKNNGGSFISMEDTATGLTWFFTHENNSPNRFLISRGSTIALALTGDGDAAVTRNFSAGGDATITGTLTTGGPTCSGGCDRVFADDYPLPTIEEHAAQMYEHSFLPEVGPTAPNVAINVAEKLGGMLNELEKAHIYVNQLNEEVKVLRQRLEELEAERGEQEN